MAYEHCAVCDRLAFDPQPCATCEALGDETRLCMECRTRCDDCGDWFCAEHKREGHSECNACIDWQHRQETA